MFEASGLFYAIAFLLPTFVAHPVVKQQINFNEAKINVREIRQQEKEQCRQGKIPSGKKESKKRAGCLF